MTISASVASAEVRDSTISLQHSPLVNGYTAYREAKELPVQLVYNPNSGLDIYSDSSVVRSVNGGRVSKVFNVAGGSSGAIVMVVVGDSFFVYNGLSSVVCREGDILKEGTAFARCEKNEAGVYQLNFQVWKRSTSKGNIKLPSGDIIAYLDKKSK